MDTKKLHKLLLLNILILPLLVFLFYPPLDPTSYPPHSTTTREQPLYIQHPDNPLTYYSSLPRPPITDYTLYILNTYDDHYIYNYIEDKSITEIIDYVHTLPCITEPNQTEYPQYPLETLQKGGDCEDLSILTAQLLYLKNPDADLSLLVYKNHMAVSYNNEIIELIRDNPLQTPPHTTYPLQSHSIFTHHWNATIYQDGTCRLNITTSNYGDLPTPPKTITIDTNNQNQTIYLDSLPPFTTRYTTLIYTLPLNQTNITINCTIQ